MAMSAPSFAKAMATALPMPLSPRDQGRLILKFAAPPVFGFPDLRAGRHFGFAARLPFLVLGRTGLSGFFHKVLGEKHAIKMRRSE